MKGRPVPQHIGFTTTTKKTGNNKFNLSHDAPLVSFKEPSDTIGQLKKRIPRTTDAERISTSPSHVDFHQSEFHKLSPSPPSKPNPAKPKLTKTLAKSKPSPKPTAPSTSTPQPPILIQQPQSLLQQVPPQMLMQFPQPLMMPQQPQQQFYYLPIKPKPVEPHPFVLPRPTPSFSIHPAGCGPSPAPSEGKPVGVSKSTYYRYLSKGMDPAKAKERKPYSCRRCDKVVTDDGHERYYGYKYCPNDQNAMSYEDWFKFTREEYPRKKKEKKDKQQEHS
eukprot:TCONS_00037591-protein